MTKPEWTLKKAVKNLPRLNNPVLVEGLPGMGNIGKVVVDFIVDELEAEKLFEVRSSSFPHSVFINEQNLIELPKIEVYFKKFSTKPLKSKSSKKKSKKSVIVKKRDIIFIAGDIQPIDEKSSYEFCYAMLDMMKQMNSKELITIGGIGLPEIPEKPRVFCTGNSKRMIKEYTTHTPATTKLFGFIGPIVGVTGLLAGLAKEKNIESACLLAETFAHPLHLGIKGSKQIIKILDNKLHLGVDLKRLEKEIKEVEEELIQKTKQLSELNKKKSPEEVSYIG